MADWIKLECTTPDKPEIVHMAATLRIDQDAVVGKLLRVWVWADQNSVAGAKVTITASFIDRLTSRKGFAAAMRAAGWLLGDDGAMTFPNFDRHNGVTGKARSETARRMGKLRGKRHTSAENVTENPSQKAHLEVEGEVEKRGGGGGPPPPSDEDEDAQIPTKAEVIAAGGPAGIPPDYCENFHDKTTEKRLWLNGYGKLVQWRKQLTRFWASDRAKWVPAAAPIPPLPDYIKTEWPAWLKSKGYPFKEYQFAEEFHKSDFHQDRKKK
jgi:hypothetical protein